VGSFLSSGIDSTAIAALAKRYNPDLLTFTVGFERESTSEVDIAAESAATLGVKHFPVPWDRMKYAVALDAYEINLSDEELARAPLFEGDEEFDWGYREDVIGDLNFYRTPPY